MYLDNTIQMLCYSFPKFMERKDASARSQLGIVGDL
jgi:hypothetical protein